MKLKVESKDFNDYTYLATDKDGKVNEFFHLKRWFFDSTLVYYVDDVGKITAFDRERPSMFTYSQKNDRIKVYPLKSGQIVIDI